ncbi:MAG: lyase family protein [Thermomicrobiales bacterium]
MTSSEEQRRALWAAIARAATAHVVMLRDAAIVDDTIAGSVLSAIDAVSRADPPSAPGSLSLVAAFDERVDSLSSPAAAGGVRLARARFDLAATAQRLVLRDHALVLLGSLHTARAALLDLAEDNVFTLLQAWSGASQLQPTNVAHFLSDIIAPLGRTGRRLDAALSDLDMTPLGAAALTGPGLPIDRDETADLLGATRPVASTFDALTAVDHVSALAQIAAESVLPIRRLFSELLVWLRTDPQALRLGDELLAPADNTLPQYRPPVVLERVIARSRDVENAADGAVRLIRETPYGPATELTDLAFASTVAALSEAAAVTDAFAVLVSGPIELNRAWLARNAGRAFVTAGDLADFLILEEGVSPAAAREIAALTASRAADDGLEASGINPGIIDGAALLVLGRELGVEIERLGAFLAPRRYIEKRTLLGGPSPVAVREYLAGERTQLESDRRQIEAVRRRHALAAENLTIRSHEISATASTG